MYMTASFIVFCVKQCMCSPTVPCCVHSNNTQLPGLGNPVPTIASDPCSWLEPDAVVTYLPQSSNGAF